MSTTTRRGFRLDKAREAESGEKPKEGEVTDGKGSKPTWCNPTGTPTPCMAQALRGDLQDSWRQDMMQSWRARPLLGVLQPLLHSALPPPRPQ